MVDNHKDLYILNRDMIKKMDNHYQLRIPIFRMLDMDFLNIHQDNNILVYDIHPIYKMH